MEPNGSTPEKPPAVKVLTRKVLSKQFIQDNKLKSLVDDYSKKTNAFGKMLKEVKTASGSLKDALKPLLKAKGIDVDEGSDWRATEGDDGVIIVEVLQKEKKASGRSRVPTETL
jgi:hypothetical protein